MTNIRLGFDAKRAFHNKTGLGVYSRHLIQAIQKQIPKENIVLFSPKKKEIGRASCRERVYAPV